MSKMYYHKHGSKGKPTQEIRLHKRIEYDERSMSAFGNSLIGTIFAMLGMFLTLNGLMVVGVPLIFLYPLLCLYLVWEDRRIDIYD